MAGNMASSPKPVGRHRPPLQPPPGTSFNDRVRAIGGMARNAPPPCRFERREPGRWSTGSLLGGSTSKAETDSVLVSIRQTQDHVPGTDQTKPWRCMEHAHQSVHRGHAAERRHPRRGAQDSGRISPLGQVTQRHQRKAWAGRQREAARCVHAFIGASGSRNACSPASDTSIHLESGLASAS